LRGVTKKKKEPAPKTSIGGRGAKEISNFEKEGNILERRGSLGYTPLAKKKVLLRVRPGGPSKEVMKLQISGGS